MRGLRIVAVAVALVGAAFLAARGCGERDETSTTGDVPHAAVGDPATAGAGGANGVAGRARAARPMGRPPSDATTKPTDRPLKLVILVKASPEGTPIEGATVLLPELADRPETVTDARGGAAFDVPAGQHVAHVKSPGRTTTSVHAICREGTTIHEVHLVAGARLEGRVADAATGRPLAGVKLALFDGGWAEGTWWDMPGKPFADLISDEAGAFGIDGLATGRPVTIESTFPGCARNRTSLLVAGPDVVRAEIEMEPGGCVAGIVRRADGTPVADALVSVDAAVSSGVWIPGRVTFDATTDSGGAYRIEGLDLDGVYVVECWRAYYLSAAATGIRPTVARPVVRCDLTFAPPGSLRIELAGARVSDDDVRVVRVQPGSLDLHLGPFRDLADGRPHELTPQRLRIEWDPEDGHPPIVREVQIESGAETLVRIERPPVHRVVGRIVDADGRPLADTDAVDISLGRFVGDLVESPEATFLEDGTFVIEDVAAGAWTLKADLPEHPTVLREVVVPCEPLVVAAPAAATLRFRLPDGLDGVFVRWAVEVRVPRAGGPEWESWTSGSGHADGEPLVEGPPDWMGPTRLRVAVPGFRVFERIVDVASGSHHDVVAGPLVPCGTVRGRVVDRQGRPVAGASVSFEDPDRCGDLRESVESLDDGKFADLSLPTGTGPRSVLVSASGFADRQIDFADDVPNPLEVVLSRPGRLVVRARDGADSPAIAREVQVLDAAGRAVFLAPTARTDHRGRAEFRVPPGKLRVTVGGGEPVAVDVAEEGTATVDVVVP